MIVSIFLIALVLFGLCRITDGLLEIRQYQRDTGHNHTTYL